MTCVVVLRPEPGASETLARARRLGLETVSVPLFEIERMAWNMPSGEFDGLLLTSANAVRTAGESLAALRNLPVYAVGAATAAAAKAAGLTIGVVGTFGIDALLRSIEPQLRLLHLCGEDRATGAAPAQSIAAVPVYRAVAIENPNLAALLGNVVLIHSPRAGRRLADIAGERSKTTIVAISDAAAAAAGRGWARVAVAVRPSDEALLALAARLCNKTAA